MNVKNVEKVESNSKLNWGERIAYGLGDYAGNLVYSFISAFLLVYYTEVCGMNAATAASVMAISRIFDGVSDLVMGRIVDKTQFHLLFAQFLCFLCQQDLGMVRRRHMHSLLIILSQQYSIQCSMFLMHLCRE